MSREAEAEAPEVGVERPHVLREYSLLADGERGALVGPRGDIVWMCFPRWDSEGLFSSLIGGQGAYSVTPRARFVWGGFYEPGGLIWRSRWVTEESLIECREALALPGRPERAVILRRVVALDKRARVRVVLNPRGGFGDTPARGLRRSDEGHWRGRVGDAQFLWSGAPDAEPRADGHGGKALCAELELDEGGHHDLVLVIDAREEPEPVDAEPLWKGTEAAWAERVPRLEQTAAPRDARHAYAVLSGLTSGGGGMVAAATTSLPERAQEGRAFDYRYVWIRDQSYTGPAVARAGPHQLLDEAVRFVGERLLEDGRELRPAYTVAGERVPDERQLDLPGYPGGTDTIGNWVNEQFQLDAFGEALLLFAAADRHDHVDADGWRAAEIAAEAIAARWREPDAGIWELDPANWTHSRLICAAGLRAIGRRPQAGERASEWMALADTLTSDAATNGLHPSGRWQRAPEDPRLDASLLLAAIRGAVPAEDPRTLATLRAMEEELIEDGYAYRYRPDERALGEAEGAFLLCGFWMALAWYQQGDQARAARWFERNRAACGPPGLLSEEFDVRQRQMRGNLPQAFVHALLLECAAVGFEGGASS
jgi:GH15 family glucan-1,4-alpha-glucosidase